MARVVITGKLTGLEKALKPLVLLSRPAQISAVMRKAVDRGSQPMAKEAKRLVSRDTGLMRLAIGRRVQVYRNSGVAVAIVGPRTGYQKSKQGVRRETALGKKFRARSARAAHLVTPSGRSYAPVVRRPVYYAHLLEFGRGPVRVKKARVLYGNLTSVRQRSGAWGVAVRAAAPRPFLRPAFDSTKGMAVRIIAAVVKAEVTRALKKSTP